MNNKIGAFTKFCCTIGNLPTSYMASMSYEEQLLWLCNYLEKTIIPTMNTNIEAVQELQHYFDNLDLQEEVNNKLDEMAESGELADIIAQYLQLAGVLAYNTIADMKDAENLVEGSTCRTLGDFSYTDGGGAFYKIRTITNEDTVDGYKIIALNNSDTLIAERISDELDYTNHFRYYIDGVNGDDGNNGKTPETAFKTLSRFLEEANNGKSDIRCYIISAGTYNIEKTNLINTIVHITGNVENVIINTNLNELVFYNCHLNFQNITITNNGSSVPYLEGGSLVIANSILRTPFRFYDAMATITNCTANELRFESSQVTLDTITFDGKPKTNFNSPLSFVRASNGEIKGTIKYEALEEANLDNLFIIYGGNVNFHGAFDFTEQEGADYSYSNFLLNYCHFIIDSNDFYSLLDAGYNLTGTGYTLSNIAIRNSDLGITQGTLDKNNSYFTGSSVILDFNLTGISVSANTTLNICTLASYLRPASHSLVNCSNSSYSPTYCWCSNNGKITIKSKDALSNSEIGISANYVI